MYHGLLVRAAVVAALLFPITVWADSTVPALTSATTLTSSVIYVGQGGTADRKAGFDTTAFCLSTGNITLCSGGVTNAMLANSSVTLNSHSLSLGGSLTLGFSDLSGQATNAQLATQSANTVLGALTATTPSGLALPSCVDSGGNHLNYTSGTGFSCGTSSTGGTPVVFVGAAAGTAPTYTIASPTPSGYTLVNQYVVRTTIPASQTNAGAATLNVNSTGALPVVTNSQNGLTALVGGELVAGLEYDFTYSTSSATACGSSCYVMMALPTSTVQAGTTQTISAAQWAAYTILPVTSASQTLTLPAASSLSANGGIAILTKSAVTLALTSGTDVITQGLTALSAGASATIPAGIFAMVVKSSAGNFSLSPGTISVAAGGTGIISGTSGGVPYFSGGTTMASSAQLTANLPVIGGGAGTAPSVGTVSGNTTEFATATGSFTSGDCVKTDASHNFVDSGSPTCGGGGGGITPPTPIVGNW